MKSFSSINQSEIFSSVFACFSQPDLWGQSFMHEMAREGNLLGAEFLQFKKLPIDHKDTNGRTPLHEAITSGQLDLVKFFVENGANLNQRTKNKGYTPLQLAIVGNQSDIVKYLLDKQALPDKIQHNTGKTALHIAAETGAIETLGFLIKSRSDLFAKTSTGQTALDLAKKESQMDIAQILEKLMQHYEYRLS